MKRRSFFGIAATTIAGLSAGSAVLSKILHAASPKQEEVTKVNIRINPLAVPRSKKGRSANG
jgi:hypothetical protein